MATKDFSNVNTDRVFDQLQDATDSKPAGKGRRKTYTKEEAEQLKMEGRTSGRKGVKMSRINMAFTPDVYDFIKTMSRVTGMTITDFTNTAMRTYIKEHGELYKQAIKIRNSL